MIVPVDEFGGGAGSGGGGQGGGGVVGGGGICCSVLLADISSFLGAVGHSSCIYFLRPGPSCSRWEVLVGMLVVGFSVVLVALSHLARVEDGRLVVHGGNCGVGVLLFETRLLPNLAAHHDPRLTRGVLLTLPRETALKFWLIGSHCRWRLI